MSVRSFFASTAARHAVVGGVMSVFAVSGAAAASGGHAPWSSGPSDTPAAVADPAPTFDPSAVGASSSSGASGAVETAAPSGPAVEPPADVPATDPTATEPAPGIDTVTTDAASTDTTPADVTPADVTLPTVPAPAPTTTAAPGPAPTTPPAPAPTTTDRALPQGLSLSCSATGATVSCSWSGGAVPGFARYLVLRGDGGPRGRVPFSSSDPSASAYVDTVPAAGTYSYVVIEVDAADQPLTHSNPVLVSIALPAPTTVPLSTVPPSTVPTTLAPLPPTGDGPVPAGEAAA